MKAKLLKSLEKVEQRKHKKSSIFSIKYKLRET